MKKKTLKKMTLNRETLTVLNEIHHLENAAGGSDTTCRACYYTVYWCESAPPACPS